MQIEENIDISRARVANLFIAFFFVCLMEPYQIALRLYRLLQKRPAVACIKAMNKF